MYPQQNQTTPQSNQRYAEQEYAEDYPDSRGGNVGGDYEFRDMSEAYGSIIKELTDTEAILDSFELRLRGKIRDQNGDVKELEGAEEPYVRTDRAAREFVDIIRSIVNRHTDFSYYELADAYSIIEGANNILNRWLLLQGGDVPTRYRGKISFEALALIKASLHKATNGRMLTWTKGSFNERRSGENTEQKKSIWDYVWGGRKKGST